MGFLSKALGEGSTVEFEGKTYKLAGFTLGVQALLETYLEHFALQKARALRHLMTHQDVQECDPVALVLQDITKGTYTFGSRHVAEALQNPVHMTQAIFYQIQENHPEVTPALVQRMVASKFDAAIEAMRLADADPNRTGRTATADRSGPSPAAN